MTAEEKYIISVLGLIVAQNNALMSVLLKPKDYKEYERTVNNCVNEYDSEYSRAKRTDYERSGD